MNALLAERVKTSITLPGARVWSAGDSAFLDGVAVLAPLAWDTRVLGMNAARLELMVAGSYQRALTVASELVEAAVAGAEHDDLVHVTSRVDAADDAAIHALESHGFLGVDALVTFAAAPKDLLVDGRSGPVFVRPATAEDTEPLAELAAGAFSLGRFHSDPAITPGRAQDVYREWARGCVRGTAADIVLTAADGPRLVGFVACRMTSDTITHLAHPVGTIPLIATSAQARGRGVGAALIAAAAAWFIDRGAMSAEVGTQLRNRAAARLYERCGFRLTAGALTFRRLIPS